MSSRTARVARAGVSTLTAGVMIFAVVPAGHAADTLEDPPFVGVEVVSQQPASAGAALSPVDVRFGMHDAFDRVVVDLAGTGQPGWYIRYDGDPRYQGSGLPVDVDGGAVLAVGITGVVYPTEPGAEPYVGPDEIRPFLSGIVEHVVVGSIFEGVQELFIGVGSAQPYRVFVEQEPTRLVIDIHHPPFAQEIRWLLEEGIATGYADGDFHGDWPVSRQAMAAFMYRLAYGPVDAPGCIARPFSDVDVSNPFCGEIAWLANKELTSGYPDGTFRPTEPVSRQAMAAFLQRLFDGGELDACTAAPFTDVPAAHPFCPEISWLLAEGISTGYADGTYRPTWPVSRQAMAAFLYRAVVEQGMTVVV